jgi:hypothetical protein
MKKLLFFNLTFLALLFFMGCSESDSNDPNEDENQEEIFLCTGNESTSYWPLTIGNQWTYEGGSDDLILTVVETVEIEGQEYFKIEPSGVLAWEPIYLRVDNEGNIYQHSAPGSENPSEVLYLPNSPTLNQEWDSFGNCILGPCSHYKKVEGLNETIETDDCTYEGCIAIREYTITNDGTLIDNGLIFYKQGVGYLGADGFSSYLDLVELILE